MASIPGQREQIPDIGALAFRAQWRGWPCLYVPGAVAYHRVGATCGPGSAAAAYYGSRNARAQGRVD